MDIYLNLWDPFHLKFLFNILVVKIWWLSQLQKAFLYLLKPHFSTTGSAVTTFCMPVSKLYFQQQPSSASSHHLRFQVSDDFICHLFFQLRDYVLKIQPQQVGALGPHPSNLLHGGRSPPTSTVHTPPMSTSLPPAMAGSANPPLFPHHGHPSLFLIKEWEEKMECMDSSVKKKLHPGKLQIHRILLWIWFYSRYSSGSSDWARIRKQGLKERDFTMAETDSIVMPVTYARKNQNPAWHPLNHQVMTEACSKVCTPQHIATIRASIIGQEIRKISYSAKWRSFKNPCSASFRSTT